MRFWVTVMGYLYCSESLNGLSLSLAISMLPFGCINEMITFSLKKKKKKKLNNVNDYSISTPCIVVFPSFIFLNE
jgi:hypothetical protein